MRFEVTLINGTKKIITAASVRYTDAPGFVMFCDNDDAVITFNANKVESVKTLKKELNQ